MVPERIGPYRLLGRIGTGGMGAVYEGIHEAIERRVAIKILHAAHASQPSVVTRFFNEARAVNRIEHPGLVQISDHGQLADGTLYIVMEYLRGVTLKQRLRDNGGRLGLSEALRLAKQVASALAAAHAKNIVHRDIKPENIMIVPDPETPDGERAKLLDFGIAKLVEEVQEPGSQTSTDQIIGTPLYMSPEQCRGGASIDAKADVYSLGVLLYHLVGGRPPFLGAGNGELLAKHIYEEPPPLQEFAPEAPAALADFIHKLLRKDKQQRPTMQEVFGELEALVPTVTLVKRAPLPPGSSAPSDPGTLQAPQTTIGHSAGQTNPAQPGPAPLNRRRLAVGVAVAAGALGLLVLVQSKHSGRDPKGPPAAALLPPAPSEPPPRNPSPPVTTTLAPAVRWTIQSEPTGATVLRVRDGTVLGQTPWQAEQPAAPGSAQFILRLHGYADRLLTLDLNANALREERLVRVPGLKASKRGPRPQPKAKTTKSTKGGHEGVELED